MSTLSPWSQSVLVAEPVLGVILFVVNRALGRMTRRGDSAHNMSSLSSEEGSSRSPISLWQKGSSRHVKSSCCRSDRCINRNVVGIWNLEGRVLCLPERGLRSKSSFGFMFINRFAAGGDVWIELRCIPINSGGWFWLLSPDSEEDDDDEDDNDCIEGQIRNADRGKWLGASAFCGVTLVGFIFLDWFSWSFKIFPMSLCAKEIGGFENSARRWHQNLQKEYQPESELQKFLLDKYARKSLFTFSANGVTACQLSTLSSWSMGILKQGSHEQ